MNRRSKIHVRWTTDPVTLGYSESAALVLAARLAFVRSTPDYTGSPRTALEYIASIRGKIGDGTDCLVRLTEARTGKAVQQSDLRELLAW